MSGGARFGRLSVRHRGAAGSGRRPYHRRFVSCANLPRSKTCRHIQDQWTCVLDSRILLFVQGDLFTTTTKMFHVMTPQHTKKFLSTVHSFSKFDPRSSQRSLFPISRHGEVAPDFCHTWPFLNILGVCYIFWWRAWHQAKRGRAT